MSGAIYLSSVNRYLAQRQHLAEESGTTDIVQIARDICGLHATNPTTPYMSLFARARDFTRDKLDNELYVGHGGTQLGGLPPHHRRHSATVR